jgi:hypothetical protein
VAHTAPTIIEFRARFPEFRRTPHGRITAIFAELAVEVDTTWVEADYKTGLMYLTAHKLVMEDANNTGASAALGQGPLKSQSFGDASETYATASEGGAGSSSEYDLTVYGRNWLRLLRRNSPRVLVV